MEMFPDVKALKKLADACRKSGIKTFKGYGLEFTLADELPKTAKAKNTASLVQEDKIDTEALPDEDLLFWSTGATDQGTS